MKARGVDEVQETYTVQEVARLLKCSDQTVRKLIREHELRGAKVGRGWRICQAIWRTDDAGVRNGDPQIGA